MHNLESENALTTFVPPVGRILAIDLGSIHTGVAVCDENRISIRRLKTLIRTNWKKFVHELQDLCRDLDARAVVIGLPLNMNGSHGAAALDARRVARNLELSLRLPIYLQDERLTSQFAADELKNEGSHQSEITEHIHSQSAVLILRDFLNTNFSAPYSVHAETSLTGEEF